jgi:hypothetical protein
LRCPDFGDTARKEACPDLVAWRALAPGVKSAVNIPTPPGAI